MRRRVPRRLRDTVWAAAGVAGAFAGIRAMEALRPEVVAEDFTAPESRAGTSELTRAYLFSAAAIVASPALGAPVLPRACRPLALTVALGSIGLRVRAMRALRGHYSRAPRVVEDQPVIRDGPYRYVRHPGYLAALLLWGGAALTARNVVAPVLTLTAVGTAYRHRTDAEDALLRRELPGYAEYAASTPRMIPTPGAIRSAASRPTP